MCKYCFFLFLKIAKSTKHIDIEQHVNHRLICLIHVIVHGQYHMISNTKIMLYRSAGKIKQSRPMFEQYVHVHVLHYSTAYKSHCPRDN